MKYCIILVGLFFILINSSYSNNDQKVLKEGQVLAQKLYSNSEATYVVSNASEIYICSMLNNSVNCLLTTSKLSDLAD